MTLLTAGFKMLELLFSGCTAIAGGVRIFVDILKFIAHVNYEIVAAIVRAVTITVAFVISVHCQLKQIISTAAVTTADFFHEVYIILLIILTTIWKSIIVIGNSFHLFYANVIYWCLLCYTCISACCLTIADNVIFIFNMVALSANISINVVITAVSTFIVAVTTLGSCCVYFVAGVWQGLGFVLSSVASFPTYCVQSFKNIWINSLDTLTNVLTVTTKETYLGIMVLCLVYLTLSNTFRYLYSKGQTLFPRRLHTRRARDYTTHWQFDRGFESDFDDLYSSDTEGVSWVAPAEAHNDSDADSDDGDDDRIYPVSNNSENNSDIDEESNSEEYTVDPELEDSDSDASINSHTYSTESSDHEIEVQLPPVDKCYSLSRSSTPSRASKTVSQEEFNREMEQERDKRKCVICQDQIKSVLILPCRHMCMCVLCAGQIVRSRTIGRRVCPLCRTKITKVMNVYV